MNIINMDDVVCEIVDEILGGSIIIYPTDTIYGIGCNALIDDAVKKIFRIKKRPETMPLSVIAPSFEWISRHCDVEMDIVRKYLPGPYTLIVKKKDKNFLCAVSSGRDTVGVRIVKHPIMKYIEMGGVPVVTTSVNVSGCEPICDVKNIPEDISRFVDVAIDDGVIPGKPSKIVDLSDEEERTVER